MSAVTFSGLGSVRPRRPPRAAAASSPGWVPPPSSTLGSSRWARHPLGSLHGGPVQRALEGQAVVDGSWVAAQNGDGTLDRAQALRRDRWCSGRRGSPAPRSVRSSLLPPSSCAQFGLDVIFPAFFLVLLLDALARPATARADRARRRRHRRAAASRPPGRRRAAPLRTRGAARRGAHRAETRPMTGARRRGRRARASSTSSTRASARPCSATAVFPPRIQAVIDALPAAFSPASSSSTCSASGGARPTPRCCPASRSVRGVVVPRAAARVRRDRGRVDHPRCA